MSLQELLDSATEVERLHLNPGDALVLKVPFFIDRADVDRMTEIVRTRLQDPTVKVIVLDGGIDISVVEDER